MILTTTAVLKLYAFIFATILAAGGLAQLPPAADFSTPLARGLFAISCGALVGLLITGSPLGVLAGTLGSALAWILIAKEARHDLRA